MADERIHHAIKIVDPTTTSQQAAVDASGNLSVILASNTGVDIGDVDVTSVIPGVGATNLGKAEDQASVAADTLVAVAAIRDDALTAGAEVDTDGDYTFLRVDNEGAVWTQDRVLATAVAGGQVQVDVVAALPAGGNAIGTVTIDAAIPTGANTIGEVTIGAATTAAGDLAKAESSSHVSADVGVMALAVRDDTPVGLAADGEYIPLTTDSVGRLHVTDPNAGAGTPAGEVIDISTVAAVAAGSTSTTNLQTAELGGSTKKLTGVDVSSSVPMKVEIQQVDNDVAVTKIVLFGRAAEPIQWRPVHKDYFEVTFGATGGFDGWRTLVTNQDTSEAADLYATMYTED